MGRADPAITKSKRRKETREIVKAFSMSLVVAMALSVFVRPTLVKGQSMEPAIQNNDYLIVSSASLLVHPPEFGDLIVFNSRVVSKEGQHRLLKRVIGVPGDTIEIKEGCVYRNDEALTENYLAEGVTTPGIVERLEVPQNQVFVLGDNRAHSLDSRNENLGTVAYREIVGRVELRLFPLSRAGGI